MLRCIYLLCLLICIHSIFCYEYIEQGRPYRSNNLHTKRDRRSGRVKRRVKKSNPKYEYDYGNPVQEFDVASFIQRSPEDGFEDEPYGYRIKKRRIFNNYDYSSGLTEENTKKRDKNQVNVLDIDVGKFGNDKMRNVYNIEHLLLDPSEGHKSAKKSAFKNMKFPFFSHNKDSQTVKPGQKRKMFCFNCPKKDKDNISTDGKKLEGEANMPLKIKRSFRNKLCPVCRKRFASRQNINDRQKTTSSKVIHNSRQYYQTVENLNDGSRFEEINTGDTGVSVDREKRAEKERDRQLKELEEVQKKIDAIEIRMPTFEKRLEQAGE